MKLTKTTVIATAGSRTSTAFLPDGRLVVAQDYGERPQLTVFIEGKAAFEITEALDKAKVSRRMLPHVETSGENVLVSYKTGTKGLSKACQHFRGVWLCKVGLTGKAQFVQALGEIAGNGQVQILDDGCEVMGRDGLFTIYNGAFSPVLAGRFPLGDSGEKCQFRLDASGKVHTMMNGYNLYSSRYNSDYLITAGKPPIMVFSDKQFPQMGDDLCHPGLGVDRVKPKRAFVGSYFGDAAFLRMITPAGKLTGIARYAATFEGRHGPQMIPRPNGGCVCLFNRGGFVMAVTSWKGSNKWGAAVALCPGRYASGAFSPVTGKLTVCAQVGKNLIRYDFD